MSDEAPMADDGHECGPECCLRAVADFVERVNVALDALEHQIRHCHKHHHHTGTPTGIAYSVGTPQHN
jgi:hypothetical protein